MTRSVSIVVAAWNAAPHIANALQSALDQTEGDFELLVVDDGSSDGTSGIVEAFAARDDRVRLLRMARNGGPARARNAAIEMSEGEWITILDADDRYHPRRLEIMLQAARTHDVDFIADNQVLAEVTTGRSLGVMFPDLRQPRLITPSEFIRRNMPGQTKRKYGLLKPFMRRSFLDRHGLRYDEDARFASDFLLYFAGLIKGCRFLVMPDPLYWYSLTPGAITRTRTVAQMRYVADRVSTFLDAPEVRQDPELRKAIERRSRVVEKDIAFNTLIEPLRRRRFGDALGRLVRRPGMLPYVAGRLLKSGMFRLFQALCFGRSAAKRWTQAARRRGALNSRYRVS